MNRQQIIQAELQKMSDEDLKKMLRDDPIYKMVIAGVPEKDRPGIEQVAMEFMGAWKSGMTDNLVKMAENPKFIEEFMRVMYERDPMKRPEDDS